MSTLILPNIAILGKMGSGKTTASDLLTQRYFGKYVRLSFAEALKVGCGTRDDRALLQTVGDGVRQWAPDFWVNLAMAEMKEVNRDDDYKFVNDDCRYPNEVAVLRQNDFVTVRVQADLDVRRNRLLANGRLQSEDQFNHISETALDGSPVDYVINTDDLTPDDLFDLLGRIVNKETR